MKRIIVSLMFVLAVIPLMAGGNITLEIADNYFSRLAYTKAAEYYQKFLNKNEDDTYALGRLAKCYELTNDYEKQVATLDHLVKLEDVEPEAFLSYAGVLQLQGKFDKAAVHYERFLSKRPDDRRAANQLNACRTMDVSKADGELRYVITNMEFNTDLYEYGPNIFNNTLLYTSTTSEDNTTKKVNQWTGDTYSDIKQFERDDKKDVFIFFNEMDDLNTKYNDGIFTVDSRTDDFYYTRNNYDPDKYFKKKGLNSQEHMNLKIYVAENHIGEIDAIREFPYNSEEYNTAHPTISRYGKYMVFVSDSPDSNAAGGRDLFYCTRDSAGWKEPKVLSHDINTEGDEIFPMFHKDGSLYFSSDGLGSIGGLDVFQANIDFENNEVISIRRLESNINSTYDDFGIVFDNSRDGYFTSDRPGGKGKDDIYAFEDRQLILNGTVVDAESGDIIPHADVAITRDGVELFSDKADENGFFTTIIYKDRIYDLLGDQDVYHEGTEQLNTEEKFGEKPLEVALELEPVKYFVRILEQESGLPVDRVMVGIDFGCDKRDESVMTGVTGLHRIPVYKDCQYDFRAKTSGYLSSRKSWTSSSEDKDDTVTIYLEKITYDPVVLHSIYYDFDKATIRVAESSQDLDMLQQFMKDNPELTIQINSHTDSRGSRSYNNDLSQRRAQAVVDWLTNRYVNEDHLNARGFGEDRLINNCSDRVRCTEEEHQLNRRTEFQVINADGSTKISSDAREDIKTDPCVNCPF